MKWVRVSGLAVVAVLLAVCASGSQATASPGHATPKTLDTVVTPVASHRPTVSVRLVLPRHTMRAGSTMIGHLLVTNHSGHAIHVNGCFYIFATDLTSKTYHPVVAWPTCLQRLTIPAGHHRYRALLQATYNQCSENNPPPGQVKCLPGGRMPPLPPGKYRAKVFQNPKVARTPPTIPVRVTPRKHP
jgi:hypothetical protein